MPILAMYSNTCTYERQLCFDVCFHLLSCFTRLPTSTALQATPNPTTPDVMGPPWPEHTRQSRNAPCPQSFGTLPSRRKKNPQIAGMTFESRSTSSMPVRPTWLPNNHVPVFYRAASDPMNLWGVFFLNVFTSESPLTSTYDLRVDLQVPMAKTLCRLASSK